MRTGPRIVLLSAGFGEGHAQVSRTLQRKFADYGCRDAVIVDLFREGHPTMNAFAGFLYARSTALSEIGLDYYGWSYYRTREMKQDGFLAKWLGSWGVRKLAAVMRTLRPDALVATFPFGGAFEYIRMRGMRIPTYTVITDFTLHNRWLSTTPDRFFVATDDLKREMIRRSVPESRIAVTGIPIRETFYGEGRPAERERSVLIMAGALGMPRRIREIARRLSELPGTKTTVVCGRNETLRRELEAAFAREPDVDVRGYVERIDELMRRSSCLVTKAGGVTLSEALQIGIPIVVHRPIPGQEKENALYLAGKGLARISYTIRDLLEQTSDILDNEEVGPPEAIPNRTVPSGCAAETIVEEITRSIGRDAGPAPEVAARSSNRFGKVGRFT
ncbi:MGDG synthase family glycosyltransferase [Paenibacillus flagellatus]|uniref:Galactosyldiacylglycerol synthase n=1 Tax=Paenibacillus flagellatus TaxID=2211139 RepID=A0A2V5KCU6_9BACL|nr:glycosyltransferase [Paenibacillus flagellatus]PYI57455.1 galactosyldiacylglycerol synthase [Paenibacillus flagellatus]